MNKDNEIDILLKLLASGHPEQLQYAAFKKLYLFYWKPLRTYAEKRTPEKSIDDILQDVFAFLWLNRRILVAEKISNKSQLEKWLLDSIRSKSSNVNKFNQKHLNMDDEFIMDEMNQKIQIPCDQIELIDYEHYEKIQEEIIRKLPQDIRLIYSLKKNYGYSIKEIALYLRMSETQVRDAFDKAKKKIEGKILRIYKIEDLLSTAKNGNK